MVLRPLFYGLISFVALVSSQGVTQTTIVQSNVGTGCSTVCIDGNCTSNCDEHGAGLIKGNGKRESRVFDLSGFDSLSLVNIEASVTRDTNYSVVITTDSNLLDFVEVSQNGAQLSIEPLPGQYEFSAIEVKITLPSLRQLRQAGSADLHFSGFDQPAMALLLQGSGNSTGLNNRIGTLTLQSQGTGSVDLTKSRIDEANLLVEGTSEITLAFSENAGVLEGRLMGASELRYCGDPENRLAIMGAADVVKTDCRAR